MQKNAPEFLDIEVLSVRTVEGTDKIDVDVESRVTGITRSKSGLEVGEVIHINYVHRSRTRPLVVGASPVPLLEKNKRYPAFLIRAYEKRYEPAAGGKSFEVIAAGD